MLTKNQQIQLTIETLGSELEGIGHYEGMTIFVTGALPNETILAHITKVHPRYAFAKLIEVITPSEDRVDPPCEHYSLCGGCSGQHMNYAATLETKRNAVFDCLTRIAGLDIERDEVCPVLPSDPSFYSRNKTSLPISGAVSQPLIGFYRRRSHAIVPIDECQIAMGGIEPIIVCLRQWMIDCRIEPYNEEKHRGLLRHLVIRKNRKGDVMITLVSTQANIPHMKTLIARFQEEVEGFCSLHISVNKQRNNVILGKTSQKCYGLDVLEETLLGLSFAIAPLSFFQVNPNQTERLYQSAIDFAELKETDLVVDAYAGAGTIALCMARNVREVIGIEIVPQAIESAKKNADTNNIKNASFYCDAVENLLPKLVEKGLRPDVVMLDPPRKGADVAVLEAVLKVRPRTIVYVSCHVPTQARDAKILCEGGYKVTGIQPVDMFCYAGGVENILCFSRED